VGLVDSAYRGDTSRAGWTTEADLLDGPRTDIETVSAVVDAPGSAMLLAETDGHLAGCCQLERRPGGEVYFGMFAVRPGLQSRGRGQEILAEAEQLAREEWGAVIMVMTVLAQRRDLIAWYQRRGYRLTGRGGPYPYGDERFGIPVTSPWARISGAGVGAAAASVASMLGHDIPGGSRTVTMSAASSQGWSCCRT
jgi:ribosomal protein S18 acetylase RimI-like enzyme